MELTREGKIFAIKNSGKKISIVATGGGSQFLHDFLIEGGASKVLESFEMPYSCEAISDYLNSGKEKLKFNSEKTARRLSVAAFYKHKCDIAVGITCSLYTENQREGRENSAYISIYTKNWITVKKLALNGSRFIQEYCLSEVVTNFILDAINNNVEVTLNNNYFAYSISEIKENDFIYSGSFNPLHDGHRSIINFIRCLPLPNKLWIDICPNHFYKNPIDGIEIANRFSQFSNELKISTQSPTILEKAKEIGKKITFILGEDVLAKISIEDQDQLAKIGCKLLLFKRGGYKLENVGPYFNPNLRHSLQEVVDKEYIPVKLSSTEIRENN